MIHGEIFNTHSDFHGLMVCIADSGSVVVMSVVERKAQLLQNLLRQVLCPAVGAYDGIELHLERRTE